MGDGIALGFRVGRNSLDFSVRIELDLISVQGSKLIQFLFWASKLLGVSVCIEISFVFCVEASTLT